VIPKLAVADIVMRRKWRLLEEFLASETRHLCMSTSDFGDCYLHLALCTLSIACRKW